MDNKTINHMGKLQLTVLIIGSAAVIGGIVWLLIDHDAFAMRQNIYFTELEGERDKIDTIIFKYDQENGELIELGKVSGYLEDCVIDKEEKRITGFLRGPYSEGGLIIDIIEYDIETGTITEKNMIQKIHELTMDTASWRGYLYDGGNKILISYWNDEDDRHLLSYDMETGESEDVDIYGANNIYHIAINEQSLWYMSRYGSLDRYDWQTKEGRWASNMPFSPYYGYAVVVEPTTGMVAYAEDNAIYVYDIDQGESNCIVAERWNIFYGNLRGATWVSDGRQFCYVRSFGLLFNASIDSLMVYDIKSGRSRCIYRLNNYSYHDFQFIPYN